MLRKSDVRQPLSERTPCQKSKKSQNPSRVFRSDAQTGLRCPVLEFTARQAAREQAQSTSFCLNKSTARTAGGDFSRSPHPAVLNLSQPSFSVTFGFITNTNFSSSTRSFLHSSLKDMGGLPELLSSGSSLPLAHI